uniref:Uncharacterized protein n=1 Tax=Anopheles farauti TaxID=69004 RepID=A0A182QRG0_9DIPT
MSRVPGAHSSGGLGANSHSSAVPHGVEENLNDGVSSAVNMADVASIGRPLSNLMPGGGGMFATAGEAVASPTLMDNLAENATGRMFTETIDGESPLEKLERNVARAVDKVTDPELSPSQMLMVGQMSTYMTDPEEVEAEVEAEEEAEVEAEIHGVFEDVMEPHAADADATDATDADVEQFGQMATDGECPTVPDVTTQMES